MSAFEWLTLVVSLTIGFGGALLAGWFQRRQAADQRTYAHLQARRQDSEKRLRALLNYERALREQVISIEGSEYGISSMPRPKDIRELMKAAYPYFYDLRLAETEADQAIFWRLFDPGAGDHTDDDDYLKAYAESCDAASELITRYKRADAWLYELSAADRVRSVMDLSTSD